MNDVEAVVVQAILEVQDVSKIYRRHIALEQFSLDVKPGVVHGLLGPNGSGKTTCLHIIAGLLTPSSGTVSISGTPIESKLSRHQIGFAPDDLPLPDSLTGQEYLRFHDGMRKRNDDARAAQLSVALGLEDDLGKLIGEYSHGMKRKIQVIASLMHEPEILLLDEPFRGLDPDAASVLKFAIEAFARSGRAVLIATHDMLRAQRDCDEVTILNAGRTVAQGSSATLIEATAGAKTLEDVFLTVTGLAQDNETRLSSIKTMFTQPQEEMI